MIIVPFGSTNHDGDCSSTQRTIQQNVGSFCGRSHFAWSRLLGQGTALGTEMEAEAHGRAQALAAPGVQVGFVEPSRRLGPFGSPGQQLTLFVLVNCVSWAR
jgi:hypothetical protein